MRTPGFLSIYDTLDFLPEGLLPNLPSSVYSLPRALSRHLIVRISTRPRLCIDSKLDPMTTNAYRAPLKTRICIIVVLMSLWLRSPCFSELDGAGTSPPPGSQILSSAD